MKQMELKSFIYLLAISEVILVENVNTSNLPIAIYLQKTTINNTFNILFPDNFKMTITIIKDNNNDK